MSFTYFQTLFSKDPFMHFRSLFFSILCFQRILFKLSSFIKEFLKCKYFLYLKKIIQSNLNTLRFLYLYVRSRRFQGFQYRLRYRYQKKGLDDSDTDIDTRDGQNSIPIPILIPRLCKCYKVKYEEMSKFIEWGTQK